MPQENDANPVPPPRETPSHAGAHPPGAHPAPGTWDRARGSAPTFAAVGLLVLGVMYTLYFAAFIFMPLAFAVVLAVILMPLVRAMRTRLRLPAPIGAGVVLLAIFGTIAAAIIGLTHPAANWIQEGLAGLQGAEVWVRDALAPLQRLERATERLADIAALPGEPERPVVQVREATFAAALLDWTRGFLVTAAIIVVLLYFLLATGDRLLARIVAVLPKAESKERALHIVDHVQSGIASYLLTITFINALLGVAIGLAMWLLGLPAPIFWGVLAALLNFIPYIGAIVGVVVLGIVALVTFDSLPYAILVAGVYYALTGLEGNFIVPAVLGRRLELSPVMVFLALVFWGWIWGIPGALLAVPLLAILKIVCEHVESLEWLGEVLGR